MDYREISLLTQEWLRSIKAVPEKKFPLNPNGVGAYGKVGKYYIPLASATALGIKEIIHECD